ncbi:MAG TPA: DUF1559 domain-containing protein [Planctomycetaceae bacterium]|jgi:hypothetical protein|nr:DUF1559 domain-containing protein [Planctomycetaceae bacterium]
MKWVLIGAGAGGVCGLVVLLVILLVRRGSPASEASSVAKVDSQKAPVTETNPPIDETAEVRAKLTAMGAAVLEYRGRPGIRARAQRREHVKGTGLSWRVKLLPELGHQALYDRFHFDEQWDSPNNKPLADEMPDAFRIGSSKEPLTRIRAYTGSKLAFTSDEVPTRTYVPDGLENTAMIFVVGPDQAVPWTKPDDLLLNAADPAGALGLTPGEQIELVLLDGKLLTLPQEVDPTILTGLITPSGGELVDGAALRAGRGIRRKSEVASASGPAPASEQQAPGKVAPPPAPEETAVKLGRALGNYVSATRRYPVARVRTRGPMEGFDAEGRPLLSWRVHLLPQIGQMALYKQFNKTEPWDSPQNKALLPLMPELYRTTPGEDSKTQWHMLSGKDALTDETRGAAPRDVKDGTENTIGFVLAGPDRATYWTKPDNLPFDRDNPLAALGESRPSKIYCVMLNGQPLTLPGDIAPDRLAALVTPNGGEILDVASLRRAERQHSGKPTDLADPEVIAAQTRALQQLANHVVNARNSGAFPVPERPAFYDEEGTPKLSWRVHVLPYLNQRPLYNKFHLNERWDSPNNLPLMAQMPDIYRAVEDPPNTKTTRILAVEIPEAPPAGPGGGQPPMRRSGQRRFSDRMNPTILLALTGADRAVSWTKPDDLEVDAKAPLAGLGTIPPTGFYVVMTNGRVFHFRPTIPGDLFKTLCTPTGGFNSVESKVEAYLIK